MSDHSAFIDCEACGKRIPVRGDYPVLHIAANSDEWCAGVDRDDDELPPVPSLPLWSNRPGV